MGTDKHTLEHTGDKERTSSNLDVATLKKGTKFRYKWYLYHVLCKCNDNDTTLIIAKKIFRQIQEMVALRDYGSRPFRGTRRRRTDN